MKHIHEAIKQLKLYIEDSEENRSRVGFTLSSYWKSQYKKVGKIIKDLENLLKD